MPGGRGVPSFHMYTGTLPFFKTEYESLPAWFTPARSILPMMNDKKERGRGIELMLCLCVRCVALRALRCV